MDSAIGNAYLEPGQVPTNIVFHKGQPVHLNTDDFKVMLNK